MHPLLLLPLLSAFLYALSSLFLKRGFEEGVGFIRTLFLSNLAMGILILGLLPFQTEPVHWDRIHLPLIAAVFFFLGQTFTFVAIRVGDVSVVTPTMGTKVIFVAILASLFFGHDLSFAGWMAVVLAGFAVALLGIGRNAAAAGKGVLPAIGWALLSSMFFATCDNLVSAWSIDFGRPAFVMVLFVSVSIFSLGLIPFFNAPLRSVSRKAWPWVLWGAGILGLQALLLGVALTYEDPTVTNTLYSSRGLWAVVLVSTIGLWFGNREGELPRWILAARLGGSLLILVAIYLMLFVAGVE
ncbi:DMT family transporter [Puniceicoccus vermicola]|uniref:DMT family transporter n=1 Tax=Puniceicoccus vermicola TaxID=388746 RepID=A0A7X1B2E0_9BACT|nr:DMT family transporter [Puniceicoccus vermicola]MBC2604287.1 DMT family transporter [Puniceicoccus vermicola]